MLRDSPRASSASHEDEAARGIGEVAVRIASAADGSACTFGVFGTGALAGVVAFVHPLRKKLRHGTGLAGMYVAPVFRRHGFGAFLQQAVIAHARFAGGTCRPGLGISAANAAARALYRSAGFARWSVHPRALWIDGAFHDEEHLRLCLDAAD